jgi:hypothetical protein
MRRKEEVISGPERSGNVLVLQEDLRGTSDDDYPFIPRLIEPFAGGRCLTGRDDPLDPGVCRRQQLIEAFRLEAMRDVSEQTAGRYPPKLFVFAQGRHRDPPAADRN